MSDTYTCFSCGIRDNKVECVGIFHCPNPFCHGCGGANFRHKLPSFKEVGGSKHTVDETEWAATCISFLEKPENEALKLKVKIDAEKISNPYKYFNELCK